MLQPIYLANQTLEAIERAMVSDQGNAFRRFQKETLPQCEDAYREDENGFRAHLGASLIGDDCSRKLWYSWHWAKVIKFKASTLRLFNRGHLEEGRFVAMLLMIGCEVWQFDEKGKQYRIKGYRGHFGGGLDCVIRGLPEFPDVAVLGEFKTHNDKSFTKLKAEGVRLSKFQHYVQMQKYMGKWGLPFALYLAVNKNNDEIYGEIIVFDQDTYDRFEVRVRGIIDSPKPPPKIKEDASWFQCKWCDYKGICHGQEIPAKNCRTCEFSEAVDNGKWVCNNPSYCVTMRGEKTGEVVLSEALQLKGCAHYQLRTSMQNRK